MIFYEMLFKIPCVGISFLTALVFYLPSAGGEKVKFNYFGNHSIISDIALYFNSHFIDSLLFTSSRDHSFYFACYSFNRQIPSFYNGPSYTFGIICPYPAIKIFNNLQVITTCLTLNVHYRNPSTHKVNYQLQYNYY